MLIGDARRREYAAPVREDQVDPGLGQGRGFDALETLLAGDGEDPEVAVLDLARELAEPGHADVDLLAEQRGDERTAAVVRDVADVVGVDLHLGGELHREQVVGSSGAGTATDVDRARVRLPCRDQVLDRLVRRVGGHHDALLLLDEPGDRGHPGRSRVRLVRVDRADDAEAHRHDQVLGALLVEETLHRDRATGADDVADLEAAGELVLLHRPDRGATGEVVAAAGAVGDHHPQPPVAGVVGVAGDTAAARDDRQCERGQERHQYAPRTDASRATRVHGNLQGDGVTGVTLDPCQHVCHLWRPSLLRTQRRLWTLWSQR